MTRSGSRPRDANALRAEVRELTERYRSGGRPAFVALENLIGLLLRLTVLHRSGVVRLWRQHHPDRATIGGARFILDPLPLNDGRLLRLAIDLFLARDDPRGPLLKVSRSSFQYQLDPEAARWVFRYEYDRDQNPHSHPQAHLQLRGDLGEPSLLAQRRALERLHFPTGRMPLEGVIRLLVEEFGVPCNQPASVWRPVLAETERSFLEIAHVPLSGPAA